MITPAFMAQAQAPVHELKAVFLMNFLDFLKWPREQFADNNTARICVVGDSAVSENLQYMAERKKSRNRFNIEVVNAASLRDVPTPDLCHIVYIDTAHKSHMPALFEFSMNRPILTVSNLQGFASAGGAIEFKPKGDRLTLRINRDLVHQSGLSISPHLLALAEVVDSPQQMPWHHPIQEPLEFACYHRSSFSPG